MSTEKITWGLASTARVNRHLVASAKFSSEGTIVAVGSRSQEKAAEYAKSIGGLPHVYPTYDELYASSHVDIIYCPLPNDMHAAAVCDALRKGKHVLCEKPMALTEAEIDAMFRCAEANNRLLTEGVMSLHSKLLSTAKDLIHTKLGRIIGVSASFTYTMSPAAAVTRTVPFEKGGGSLWDVGCYPLSAVRFLLGAEPIALSGQHILSPVGVPIGAPPPPEVAATLNGSNAFDASYWGTLEFPGGIRMQFDSGFAGPYRTSIHVFGTQGSITMTNPFKPDPRKGEFIEWVQPDPSNPVNPWKTEKIGPIVEAENVGYLYQLEFDEFSRVVRHAKQQEEGSVSALQRSLLVQEAFSKNTVKVIRALHDSAMRGGAVVPF